MERDPEKHSEQQSSDISRNASPSPPPGINERKLLLKIDLRLLPCLCILYLLAFLDRVNISNAAIFGLKEDLNLGGVEYNTALTIFFVPYILAEIPSNILLKKLKPHVWLSICMILFGFTTTMQGLTQNYSGLLATRFFLGLFEAGMFPGCFYLISHWYRREEAQKRFSFFFSSTSLAGAFGGLLASAIGKMDGVCGMLGWRWIFILEGILTCVVGVIFFFCICDFPEEASFLTPEEAAYVKTRLAADVGDSGREHSTTVKDVLAVLKDPKVILGGFMYFGLVVPAYGFAYFAPTIIQGLGTADRIHIQLLSVPPWACAFVFSMVLAAASDYFKKRFVFAVFSIAVALTGFGILLGEHHNYDANYAALFLVSSGCYGAMPLLVCWFACNLRSHNKRAVGTAWQVGFGNIGGIIATYSFVSTDAPYYTKGYAIGVAFIGVSLISSALYLFTVRRENQQMEKGTHKETLEEDGGVSYRYFT